MQMMKYFIGREESNLWVCPFGHARCQMILVSTNTPVKLSPYQPFKKLKYLGHFDAHAMTRKHIHLFLAPNFGLFAYLMRNSVVVKIPIGLVKKTTNNRC